MFNMRFIFKCKERTELNMYIYTSIYIIEINIEKECLSSESVDID